MFRTQAFWIGLLLVAGLAVCRPADANGDAPISVHPKVGQPPRSRFAWLKFWNAAPPSLEPTIARAQSPESTKETEGFVDSSLRLSAQERIAAECQTGTLIFSEGDCLVVKAVTASRFTHVAVVVVQDGDPWVYDSMNGTGVRKLPLKDYLEIQSPDEVTLYHPRRPFTKEETERFQLALESQLGRPYSVRHFLTGESADGIHCAEYLTMSLMEIGWLTCESPANVSPCSLRKGIQNHHLYETGPSISIPQGLRPIPEPGSWYGEMWQSLTLCADQSSTQMSRWVLCR